MLIPEQYSGLYTVIGPPGTGKTRFLATRVPRIVDRARGFGGAIPKGKYPALICSLTRTAASEIASRCPDLPPEATATIHAHAYRSQGCPPVLESEDIQDWNSRHPAYAIAPEDTTAERPVGGTWPGATEFEQMNLLRNRMTPYEQWPPAIQALAERWTAFKLELGKLDYTDMLEQAADKPPGNPDVIIVDEAQDTSRLAYSVLDKWAKHARSLWLVGDPWQSLYVWAGAAPELLEQHVPEGHCGVLSQSYRVPEAVHDCAVAWIAQLSAYRPIVYKPRTEGTCTVTGAVLRSTASALQPSAGLDIAEEHLANGKSVMLCGATRLILRQTVEELRRRGVPFSNPWRRSEGAWNPVSSTGTTTAARLASFLKRETWTVADVARWTRMVRAKSLLRRGAKAELERRKDDEMDTSIEDLLGWFEEEALAVMSEELDAGRGLEWLWENVQPRFRKTLEFPATIYKQRGIKDLQQEPRLYIGTIHSFKGAEADTVIVYPDLPREAYTEWVSGNKDAIVRLFYVAMTRARETLVLCNQGTGRYVNWKGLGS